MHLKLNLNKCSAIYIHSNVSILPTCFFPIFQLSTYVSTKKKDVFGKAVNYQNIESFNREDAIQWCKQTMPSVMALLEGILPPAKKPRKPASARQKRTKKFAVFTCSLV